MSSTTTISCYEEACSRYRWEVPDGYNIAVRAFASSYISSRLWSLNGSRGM